MILQHVPERHEKCVTTSVKLFKMVFNPDLAEDQNISLIITSVQDFGHCADQEARGQAGVGFNLHCSPILQQ